MIVTGFKEDKFSISPPSLLLWPGLLPCECEQVDYTHGCPHPALVSTPLPAPLNHALSWRADVCVLNSLLLILKLFFSKPCKEIRASKGKSFSFCLHWALFTGLMGAVSFLLSSSLFLTFPFSSHHLSSFLNARKTDCSQERPWALGSGRGYRILLPPLQSLVAFGFLI